MSDPTSHVLVFTTGHDQPPLNLGALPPSLLQGTGPATVLVAGRAMEYQSADPQDLDTARDALAGQPVDVNRVPLANRVKRLLLADMDMTMIPSETIDEFAVAAGVADQVKAITLRAMNGELDFRAALLERLALLKGKPKSIVDTVLAETELRPGGRDLIQGMKASESHTVLVSGGFTMFTARVAELAGFDEHHANTLVFDGEHFAGTVKEPLIDSGAKLTKLKEKAAGLCITPDDAVTLGDGANDLPMLMAAGMGVAFKAKPTVAAQAQYRLDHSDLDAVLWLQGLTAPAQA